jgi:hypothetical protein
MTTIANASLLPLTYVTHQKGTPLIKRHACLKLSAGTTGLEGDLRSAIQGIQDAGDAGEAQVPLIPRLECPT